MFVDKDSIVIRDNACVYTHGYVAPRIRTYTRAAGTDLLNHLPSGQPIACMWPKVPYILTVYIDIV